MFHCPSKKKIESNKKREQEQTKLLVKRVGVMQEIPIERLEPKPGLDDAYLPGSITQLYDYSKSLAELKLGKSCKDAPGFNIGSPSSVSICSIGSGRSNDEL